MGYYFNKYVYQILDRYKGFTVLYSTINIGFTGTANEVLPPVLTDEVSADTLYFAAHAAAIENADTALVRIRSISPQYEWMSNQTAIPQDTPISAVAGISTQAAPYLTLPQPFFVKAMGRLQHRFTNSPSGQETTGGTFNWLLLKLVEPVDGGWDYTVGFKP
jgi:hypothetical protein